MQKRANVARRWLLSSIATIILACSLSGPITGAVTVRACHVIQETGSKMVTPGNRSPRGCSQCSNDWAKLTGGPSSDQIINMSKSLYEEIRKRRILDNAWRVVRENGMSSKSDVTRQQIKKFDVDANRHINRIRDQLRGERFVFLPSEGILQTKPGKTSKRPIVKSPIENRIVQRAILDVLQGLPSLKPYFETESSFGGIKGRSVSEALKVVYESMQSGAKYFIRSDIESFFTRIPKSTIYSIVSEVISDDLFLDLFNRAMLTELSNLEELGENRNKFPIYDIGVAQGSCLSPLLGNILLSDFDSTLNQGDITCIRYIDDFIILAPNKKAISAAFKKAIKQLNIHGLTAYDPAKNKEKAEMGTTTNIFTFLGCDIRPGIIRPNKTSQKRLIHNLKETFQKSVDLMSKPELMVRQHRTVTETLNDVSNVMKGWGNQYSFCNDINLMKRMDEEVDEMIANYLAYYSRNKKKFTSENQKFNRRRLLGVHLLTDSKKEPIIK